MQGPPQLPQPGGGLRAEDGPDSPDARSEMTHSVNARNRMGQAGPTTPRQYAKMGGGGGFRPLHFEKETVTNFFGMTASSASIGGSLKAIANFLAMAPVVGDRQEILDYDLDRYRAAWHAGSPESRAKEIDKAIEDGTADGATLRDAASLPIQAAVRDELATYADPEKLDKLAKSYPIHEFRGMNRVTPYGADLSPEPVALTLMRGTSVVSLYGFERGIGRAKEFLGIAAMGDQVGLIKRVDFEPVATPRTLPSGEIVQGVTVERRVGADSYFNDPALKSPNGIVRVTGEDDIVDLIHTMVDLGYKPRYTTPDERVIYPEPIKGDRVEAIAGRGILGVAGAVSRGAVDVAVDAFMRSDEKAMERLPSDADRRIAGHFLRLLKASEAAGVDPEEAKECLVFATRPMKDLMDYHTLYWSLIKKGMHTDPVFYLKEVLVEVFDLDRAADPKARSNGMLTMDHLHKLKEILAARTVTQLNPDYKDPLETLGLEGKIPQAKRMDMVMAILCKVAEQVNALVEAGEVDPKYNVYEMVPVDDGKGGTKLDRRKITRDKSKPVDDPDNQVMWPNTKIPRYLTKVDFTLKEVLDQSLQPTVKAYNTFKESCNRAMLELTMKRVLLADPTPARRNDPEHIAEVRDMVRAHLFGIRQLNPAEKEFMDQALKPGNKAAGWLDELRCAYVMGANLAAYRERITPEYLQREAFQYARDLEKMSEGKGMAALAMYPVSTYSAPGNPTAVFVCVRDDDNSYTVHRIGRPQSEDGEILPPTLVPHREGISLDDLVRFRLEENVNNAYIVIVQNPNGRMPELNDAGMPDWNLKGNRIVGETETIMRKLGAPIVRNLHDPLSGAEVNAAIFSVRVLNGGLSGMAPTTYRFLFNKGGDPARTFQDIAIIPKRLEQLCLDEREFVKANRDNRKGLADLLTAAKGPDGTPLMTANDAYQWVQGLMARNGKYAYNDFAGSIGVYRTDRLRSIQAMAAIEVAQANRAHDRNLAGKASAAAKAGVEQRRQADLARIQRTADQREKSCKEWCSFAVGFSERHKGYTGSWYGAVPDGGSELAKSDIRLRFSDVRDIQPRIHELQSGLGATCKVDFVAIEED
jgi:hypothetical protein